MRDAASPPWTWRTFGGDLSRFQAWVTARGAVRVRNSDAVHVLSDASPDDVRVCGDLLEMRRLDETTPEGLERWTLVRTEPFPLPDGILEELLIAWRIPPPVLDRRYDRERFFSGLVAPHPQLRAVAVHAERHVCPIDGGTVEVTRLHLDGQPVWSVAVEMAEPSRLLAMVREMGLGDRDHINHVMALKLFVGMPVQSVQRSHG